MKTIKYFKLILFLIIFSLNNCSSDYTENLGNGYFFVGEGSPLNKILNEKSNRGQVPENVISYDYNKDFIIAKQKPDLPQSILYEKKYEYKYGANEFYYWLIVKDEYLVLGPFNLSEFNEVRQKYMVPNALEIEK